ncbi:MAG: protein kinase [Thermoanaerobaculia bacterium]
MIGETLSHYEILDKIGEGGMGEVYLAKDIKLGRKVALKLLPAEMAGSRERLERFEREARALAALDHPGIVTIHSVEKARFRHSDPALHFLTMQLVEGSTLDRLIPPGGMPLDRLFETAVPLTEAVAAAHSKRIAHRDLKPNNVMVTDDGRVKVLDFGLAKARGALETDSTALETLAMTSEGRVLGTLPYMSPEQAQGKPIDHRTDIFSLGSMLYEMTTGWRPFDEESPAALTASILTKTPAPISTHRSDAPPRLGQIIQRCLEKDPARRYQHAGELVEELSALREAVTHHPLISTGLGRVSALFPRTRGARIGLGATVVALVATLIVAITIGLVGEDATPPVEGPQISSLAVLPLKNLSGDSDQDYFVDGMTEALTTDLSKIGALKVISRSSAMRYKGTDKPLAEIAGELGVEALVEGSVLREGDRVGITAQLIEARAGSNLWADRYERDLTSILALQGEIAQAIAREIQVTLTPEEESRLATRREVDPAAYEAYLKGLVLKDQYTPEDLQTAMQYFEKAREIDPGYAPAYSGIASIWSSRRILGLVSPTEANARMQPLVLEALELDDSLAVAHRQLAVQKAWHEWDWQGAETEFQRIFELDPNEARTLVLYGHFLTLVGRSEEAERYVKRAIELDPLNMFNQSMYGTQLMFAGRYEDAIAQLRRTLDMAPGLAFGHLPLASALYATGRYEEAFDEIKVHFAALSDADLVETLERGFAAGGFERASRLAAETLAARSGSTFVKPIYVAYFYDVAGMPDEALEWLERGYELRDHDMAYLAVFPLSDRLRSDPRFQDLLRRMNLAS